MTATGATGPLYVGMTVPAVMGVEAMAIIAVINAAAGTYQMSAVQTFAATALTSATNYGFAPCLILNGSNIIVSRGNFQSLGAPQGTVSNCPVAPTYNQSGIGYHSAIYQLSGTEYLFEYNTFSNFDICIGVQGENSLNASQASAVRVMSNNWGSSYSFGLLIRKFNSLYFCYNEGGGATVGLNPNPPHDLYVTDRDETPYRNAVVIGNVSRNGQQANPWKIRNCIGGVIANNRSDSASGAVQVEYSTDMVIANNWGTNMITTGDSGAATVRLVDSWRCTVMLSL
jgi:hypothetical protein